MQVLESIIAYIADRKQKVIAVIYLHRIIDKKITGSANINLRMLRAVCGEHFYQNIALVTSMWAAIPPGSEAATAEREVELNGSTAFWADMIPKGAHYVRWDERADKHSSRAKEIVEMCWSKKDAPVLRLLLELQNGASIEETGAGQILTEELRKRQEKERKALHEEEEERRLLEEELETEHRRLRAAQDGLNREAKLSVRRYQRGDRPVSRAFDGPTEVVVVPERRREERRHDGRRRVQREGVPAVGSSSGRHRYEIEDEYEAEVATRYGERRGGRSA